MCVCVCVSTVVIAKLLIVCKKTISIAINFFPSIYEVILSLSAMFESNNSTSTAVYWLGLGSLQKQIACYYL